MDDVDAIFHAAVAQAATFSPAAISDEDKKKLYGLYKQALEGDCPTTAPSVLNVKSRAKWTAWRAYAGMPRDEAKRAYAQLCEGVFRVDCAEQNRA